MCMLFGQGRTAHQVRVDIARMANSSLPPEEVLRLWGDFDMRLRGVYTGSEVLPPKGWYCDYYTLE